MESDERFYRRRLAEELTAARRAVTPAAKARRLGLAENFAQKLREMGTLQAPVPGLAGAGSRAWILELE